ncbi:MAG: TerB family tellurite resistance protein [Polyangiaceae bacterium]|nr:TerB family tellurite resistance protein [Polyangiaceae bacterium]
MSFDIGRDTVLALVAVAWADGKVDPAEAAGIRGAAEQLGLGADDLKVVEAALGRVFDMNEVETVRMNRHTRLFTFAAAAWIASVDGAIAAAEESVLGLLGDRLGLSQVARDRARSVALGLHAGPPSQRPGGFDLVALKSQLSVGLSQIGDG